MIEIRELTEQFVAQVTRHVEERTRDRLASALGDVPPDQGRRSGIRGKHKRTSFLATPATLKANDIAGRWHRLLDGVPIEKGSRILLTKSGRPRRKPPVQFCPAPNCKNPAAPVYRMLCAKHKDLPKAKVRKYREARKARKARG